jgi:hypothetical protein
MDPYTLAACRIPLISGAMIGYATAAKRRLHVHPFPREAFMRRQWRLVLFGMLLCRPLAAQEATGPCDFCWHAQPKEHCRTTILSNFGAYYVVTGSSSGGQPMRAVGDYGVLVNVGAQTAIGLSLFASFDTDELVLGPAVHYRRWFGSSQSLDLSLGMPLTSQYDMQYTPVYTPYGLIKYNPVHWFGIAVRPELRRYSGQSHFMMSIGAEVGWIPGVAMTAAFGSAALLVAATTAVD